MTADQDEQLTKVAEGLHTIKTHMPLVYGAIQDKSKEIGNEAFALVRKGLRSFKAAVTKAAQLMRANAATAPHANPGAWPRVCCMRWIAPTRSCRD